MINTEINYVAELFKVLGDPTRAKIVLALEDRELCVCDLAEKLKMTDSAISHQLRVLKQARLLTSRRDGKHLYYSLEDHHVAVLFDTALEHIRERNHSL
ncbi:MAG: metalloregulator ArsR/SmtB family transcription factor [Oscillospiraceae bacterium]|jgi:ArsR family transcriptional regulator|nr:metalloregulator ArsR/SmtB family transcription factor [Oscillospiraceae bacterium]